MILLHYYTQPHMAKDGHSHTHTVHHTPRGAHARQLRHFSSFSVSAKRNSMAANPFRGPRTLGSIPSTTTTANATTNTTSSIRPPPENPRSLTPRSMGQIILL
ncbi:hypothetical protein BGZ63DRAFT_111400 [Mariannaea sp. PMI_226]|nr:hypothetical protein BGZ63DRAFT_111400 [Mariannaea sp. PMI_226]